MSNFAFEGKVLPYHNVVYDVMFFQLEPKQLLIF